MKILLFLLIWMSAGIAQAGEIFGNITEDGASVGAGVTVEIAAPGKTYVVQTDAEGLYRAYVKEGGKCTLTVRYQGDTPTMEVTSQDEKTTRYDLLLEKKGGKYGLRRK